MIFPAWLLSLDATCLPPRGTRIPRLSPSGSFTVSVVWLLPTERWKTATVWAKRFCSHLFMLGPAPPSAGLSATKEQCIVLGPTSTSTSVPMTGKYRSLHARWRRPAFWTSSEPPWGPWPGLERTDTSTPFILWRTCSGWPTSPFLTSWMGLQILTTLPSLWKVKEKEINFSYPKSAL